nr:porin family protein [uncultured Flavobacterium sp.]
MKKIFTIAALIAISINANAQQEVKFGPKAGVNFANLSNTESSKMLTGFYVGGVAEIKINDKFSVQPELMYSAQGAKAKYSEVESGVNVHYKETFKLDYISIPVLAKYYIADGFSVEAGPQFNFLVKSEIKSDASALGYSESDKTDMKDFTKSFDFGIGAGVAYDLANGFFANARYNFGLSDIWKENEGKSVKNAVIQVGVGYKF